VLVPSAAVGSGGAICVGRAAAAWQQAAKRRAAPNLHLMVDSRGGCSPAARHGLGIRHELASDAACGRISRRLPGQPCAAWPSSGARRTQKAERIAAPRGVRARAGDGHRPRGIGRSRAHSVRCRAAVRRAATRKITTVKPTRVSPPSVSPPPFPHLRSSILPRAPRAPADGFSLGGADRELVAVRSRAVGRGVVRYCMLRADRR